MAASPLGRLVKYAARSTWGLTFDMSGGPRGAKRPLARPLDGVVRRHASEARTAPEFTCLRLPRSPPRHLLVVSLFERSRAQADCL